MNTRDHTPGGTPDRGAPARRGLLGKLAVTAVLLGLLIGLAPDADAARKKKKAAAPPPAPERALRVDLIDPALNTLPWEAALDETLVWVRKRLEVVYGPRLKKALDTRERSALRHELADEVRTLRRALVEFDGRRTGFEVSIVAGEFVPGAEEAVLHFREGSVDHYFFFTHGKLWKYARPMAAREPFPQRLGKFQSDQGEPSSLTERAGAEEGDEPVSARWRGRRLLLRLDDRRLLYGADLVVLEARAIADDIAELRGGKAPADGAGELDPDVIDFLEGEPVDDE